MDILPKSSLQSTKVQRTFLQTVSFLNYQMNNFFRLETESLKFFEYQEFHKGKKQFPFKNKQTGYCRKTSKQMRINFPSISSSQITKICLNQCMKINNFSNLYNLYQSCLLLVYNILKRSELETDNICIKVFFQIVFWKLKKQYLTILL